MSQQLQTYFNLNSTADASAQYFWSILKTQTSSVACHVAMMDLFATALGLNSKIYRGQTIAPTSTIADRVQLDIIMDWMPEELTEPTIQVLFENAQPQPYSGNNAQSITTYDATNPSGYTALTNVYQGLLCLEAALAYNQIQVTYTNVAWTNPSLPVAIPNPIPSNPPTSSTVSTQLRALINWITSNDPQLIALNKVITSTSTTPLTTVQMLNNIFGSSSSPPPPIPNLNIPLLCQTMIDQIQAYPNFGAGSTPNAKNIFITVVQDQLKTLDPFWISNFNVLSQAIYAKSFSDMNKTPKLIAQVFDKIRQLFQQALTLSATPTAPINPNGSQAILAIFNAFIASTANPNVDSYLNWIITQSCGILSDLPDLAQLNTLQASIPDTPPTVMPVKAFQVLCHAAFDCLTSIPLVPLTSLAIAPIQDIQLFSFTPYNKKYFSTASDNDLSNVDVITAPSDASENGTSYARPMYAVFQDTPTPSSDLTVFKFFNIGGSHPTDSFYFEDVGKPSRAITPINSIPSSTVTIDLENAQINGKHSVPIGQFGITGFELIVDTPYKTDISGGRQSNGGRQSKSNFFTAIKALTKWTDFNGRCSYDVLYELCQTVLPTRDTHLIWRLPSGLGLSRAEQIEDKNCLWNHHYVSVSVRGPDYSNLAEILDLPSKQKIKNTPSTSIIETNRSINSYSYQILKQPDKSGKVQGEFVLTNTPSCALPAEINLALSRLTASSVDTQAASILNIFNFDYYRSISSDKTSQPKLIKEINRGQSLQRPKASDGIVLPSDPRFNRTVLGIGLPISFRSLVRNIINPNIQQAKYISYAKASQQSRPTLKNKGASLTRAQGQRKNAGTVMKALNSSLNSPPAISSTLPATVFANWAIGKSNTTKQEWQVLKDNQASRLPTDQEWCHLRGHGDGGQEHMGNFVSGSYHCNTEQLAIESGQRHATHQKGSKFTLRTTAYLFDNTSLIQSGINYLQSDGAYQTGLGLYKQIHKTPPKVPSDRSQEGTVAPLAAFIRYKIYNQPLFSTTPIKMWDHLFEGQSEFMDVHQFEILSTATQFALSGKEKFDAWYQDQVSGSHTRKRERR